jgi:hypothetical protein
LKIVPYVVSVSLAIFLFGHPTFKRFIRAHCRQLAGAMIEAMNGRRNDLFKNALIIHRHFGACTFFVAISQVELFFFRGTEIAWKLRQVLWRITL